MHTHIYTHTYTHTHTHTHTYIYVYIFIYIYIFIYMYVFIQSSPNLKVFLSQVENELFSIADVLNEHKRHSNISKEE